MKRVLVSSSLARVEKDDEEDAGRRPTDSFGRTRSLSLKNEKTSSEKVQTSSSSSSSSSSFSKRRAKKITRGFDYAVKANLSFRNARVVVVVLHVFFEVDLLSKECKILRFFRWDSTRDRLVLFRGPVSTPPLREDGSEPKVLLLSKSLLKRLRAFAPRTTSSGRG